MKYMSAKTTLIVCLLIMGFGSAPQSGAEGAPGLNVMPHLDLYAIQTCNDPTGAPIPCPEPQDEDPPDDTSTPCDDHGGDSDQDGTCNDNEGNMPTGESCSNHAGVPALKGCPIVMETFGKKYKFEPQGMICIIKRFNTTKTMVSFQEFQFEGDVSFTLNPSSNSMKCFVEVPVGTYTIKEAPPPGWQLYWLYCFSIDRDGHVLNNNPQNKNPRYSTIDLYMNQSVDIKLDFSMMGNGAVIYCMFINKKTSG